jgi:hypothetical protein
MSLSNWLKGLTFRTVKVNGLEQVSRSAFNFIAGTGITITPADGSAGDALDLTLSSADGVIEEGSIDTIHLAPGAVTADVSSLTIEDILIEGNDANGKNIRGIGSGDGVYKTDANITNWTQASVVDTGSIYLTCIHSALPGMYRAIWYVTIADASGDTWGFDWLTQTQKTAETAGTLRLSKALVDPGEMEGTPPAVGLEAVVTSGDTLLTVTNNSGEALNIRIGVVDSSELPPGAATVGEVTSLTFHSYGASVSGGLVWTSAAMTTGIGIGSGAGLIASFATPGDEFDSPPPGDPTGLTIVDGGADYPLGSLVAFVVPGESEASPNYVWFTVTGVA